MLACPTFTFKTALYMRYIVDLEEVEKGVCIYLPRTEQVRVTYEQLQKDGYKIGFPFWAKIWASARAMLLFLQKEPGWVENKLVLEIGAGIGLPSLLIAKYASQIIISDYDIDAVELLQQNILHLGLVNAEARCLDWNDFPNDLHADTVVLSDINYDPEQFEALIKLINRFLSNGATVIVATPQRIMAVPFAEKINLSIVQSNIYKIDENGKEFDVSIFVLKRR